MKQTTAGLTALLVPSGFARVASAATSAPVLMMVHLRGAADGLNLVVPTGDPLYYANRPSIQVPPGDELPLDGFYGLNPALAPLAPLYQSGELCILHACGSPDPTRSHFDAQDFMDYGAPGDRSVRDGWLNRALLSAGVNDPITAIKIASGASLLNGPAPNLSFPGLTDFALTGQFQVERGEALNSRYALQPGSLLGASTIDAFAALDRVASVDRTTSVTYPGSGFAAALRDAAALIKADLGVQFVALDLGGWDHHTGEVYNMSLVADDLASSLAAFHQDLGACANTTLTLCVTEFGRRVAENGLGTEHGRGSVMLALGGGVSGGQVMTRDGWPGLAPEQLDRGQDLAVTTDFRDVFAEVLNRHIGLSLSELAPVFPSFSVGASNFPGLYA